MDGLGSGNLAIVDDSHRLYTTGSITSMPPISIGGSIFIGSVSASVDSVYIQSGDNVNLGNAWTGIGSVRVSNPVEISGINDIGSVVIKSAPLLGVSGLIFTDGKMTGSFHPAGIGSVIISSSNRLGVSGIIEISGITNDFTTTYKQYMDYDGGYQPVYIGLALPGTGSETVGWMLRKNIYENDLNVAVLFGSGNTNFDKKWSDRADANAEYS